MTVLEFLVLFYTISVLLYSSIWDVKLAIDKRDCPLEPHCVLFRCIVAVLAELSFAELEEQKYGSLTTRPPQWLCTASCWSRAATASMEYSRSSPAPPHPTLVRWALLVRRPELAAMVEGSTRRWPKLAQPRHGPMAGENILHPRSHAPACDLRSPRHVLTTCKSRVTT
jgi:hypothetical protein